MTGRLSTSSWLMLQRCALAKLPALSECVQAPCRRDAQPSQLTCSGSHALSLFSVAPSAHIMSEFDLAAGLMVTAPVARSLVSPAGPAAGAGHVDEQQHAAHMACHDSQPMDCWSWRTQQSWPVSVKQAAAAGPADAQRLSPQCFPCVVSCCCCNHLSPAAAWHLSPARDVPCFAGVS